jgi:hypothetical protein
MTIRPDPAACRSSESNEFLGGNTAAELLRTAAFSDTPQIDGGEAEALDVQKREFIRRLASNQSFGGARLRQGDSYHPYR